jgi:hypothetical protein
MNKSIDSPLFCLTSDIDWASEYAIEDFISLVSGYGIRPTVFATHRSAVLEQHQARGAIELGIHPNFLPGSSHGNDYLDVIDHMVREFPDARTFRSHCFFDSALVTQQMAQRGFTHDSNLCVYLQPRLVPLRHASGLVRFPVFFEDDVHWLQSAGDWSLERCLTIFLSAGLKVLNFHPFFVAANIPNQDYYLEVKEHIKTLTAENIDTVRFNGAGTRTFLIELLEQLTTRRQRFYTLAELYRLLPIEEFLLSPTSHAQERHAG